MPELRWTEIDGVTTVWGDGPAPLVGGLLFRSGRADETLPTTGQHHLIEHMVLSGIQDPAHRNNGFVTGFSTGFVTSGAPEEVASFFGKVCTGLSELAAERLDAERQILGAESAARGQNPVGMLLRLRYGAEGYGLLGVPDLGLPTLSIDRLREAIARGFTRENAVLWLSGPPPADMHLNLPAGKKVPPPTLNPLLVRFPCWFAQKTLGGVAASATLSRSAAAVLFGIALGERLRGKLRTEKAVSYSPAVSYDPLTANLAHLAMQADSAPERRAQVAESFIEVLEGLAEGLDPELEVARKNVLDGMDRGAKLRPDLIVLQMVQAAARDSLLGGKTQTVEHARSDYASVTGADVTALAKNLFGQLLIALPSEAKPRPSIGPRAARPAVEPISGVGLDHIDSPVVADKLTSNSDGVTVNGSGGAQLTIRYADLAAALSWNDGGLALIARDASEVQIEPSLWRNGRGICVEIRSRVPKHLLLERGDRPAEAIPRPATTTMQRAVARARILWPRARIPLLCVAVLLLALAITSQSEAARTTAVLLILAFVMSRLSK